MMYNGWGGWGIFGWLIGVAFMILFWAAVILGIVWLVRSISRQSGPSQHPDSGSAIEIARMRYARGEITKEQFEQIKRDLNG